MNVSLGPWFAEVMRTLGAHAEYLADHFSFDEDDHVWLPAAFARHWVVITKDGRIRTRRRELATVTEGNGRLVILLGGNLPKPKATALIVRDYHQIVQCLATPPPWYLELHLDRPPRFVPLP